jgi:hypothetical protein
MCTPSRKRGREARPLAIVLAPEGEGFVEVDFVGAVVDRMLGEVRTREPECRRAKLFQFELEPAGSVLPRSREPLWCRLSTASRPAGARLDLCKKSAQRQCCKGAEQKNDDNLRDKVPIHAGFAERGQIILSDDLPFVEKVVHVDAGVGDDSGPKRSTQVSQDAEENTPVMRRQILVPGPPDTKPLLGCGAEWFPIFLPLQRRPKLTSGLDHWASSAPSHPFSELVRSFWPRVRSTKRVEKVTEATSRWRRTRYRPSPCSQRRWDEARPRGRRSRSSDLRRMRRTCPP